MSNEIAVQHTQSETEIIEQVVVNGNLASLNPAQRVAYYRQVCSSLGLNPFTRPFDYITLNGKLTLYAKKDAADQLRKINSVSIDDVDIRETDTQFIVKVKGHDKTGRADVEVGVVNKKDMQGDTANAQMKAVTKAKRRLTLSLCGLGLLDETEVETIPNARPVTVLETGEIVDAGNGHAPAMVTAAAEMGATVKPAPARTASANRATLEKRYYELIDQANTLGIVPEPYSFNWTDDGLIAKGKELKAAIVAAEAAIPEPTTE